MFFLQLIRVLLLLIIASGLNSCVKDIDLNQAENITLRPDLQVDLLILNVKGSDFTNPDSGIPRTIIRDTVRLEFLDDDYIQEDLRQVELRFRFTNTFSNSFSSNIYFLSESNTLQHQIDFIVAGGDKNAPVITEIIDFTGENDIGRIRRTIEMVVEIEVLSGEAPEDGNLKFQSKGLFSFQF